MAALLIPTAGVLAQEGPTKPLPPLELAAGEPVALPATAESSDVCQTHSAPFFRGTGGFVVEPSDGRSAELTVRSDNGVDTRTVYAGRDGLAVELLSSPLCTGPNGVFPAQCQVSFNGVRGGGWYWVNGDRNAAVAPLVCSGDLGGGTAPLDPGGVQTLRSKHGTGTLFIHDTQGLMGIVPQLPSGGSGGTASCERYVAPFFRGSGGFVARPEAGRTAEVTIERGNSEARESVRPREDGLAVQLLSSSLCTDSNGQPAECRVTFTGIGPGGWYWVNGDRNAAVAPLLCEGGSSGPAAADPGGVATSRAAFGTGSLFVHDTQRLMGIVPHLPGAADDDRRVEVRVSVFGGGTVEVVGGEELHCPVATQCMGSFPAAGSLTLRAVPPAGYAFDRWQECDSVSGADCVVALHDDRLLFLNFASTQPLTFKDSVVQFDESRLADIRRYDPVSGLMVLAADARADDIEIGSVLASSGTGADRGIESGFLRRVTDVRKRSGLPVYLKTAQATLEDAIASGSLSAQAVLGASAVTAYELPPEFVPIGHSESELTVRELPDGRRAYEVSSRAGRLDSAGMAALPAASNDGPPAAVVQPISFDVGGLDLGGLKVSGTLDLRVEPILDVDFWGNEARALALVVSEFSADLEVESALEGEFKKELPGLKISFRQIPVGWGFAVYPELTAELHLTVKLKPGLEPDVTLRATLAAGVHYREGAWRGIWAYEPTATVVPPDGPRASAGVEVGVTATLAMPVSTSGVETVSAGPTLTAGPSLGVNLFSLTPSIGGCAWDFSAYLGGEVTAGVELAFWKWELASVDLTLWNGTFPLPLGRRGCDDPDTTAPPSPASLRFPSTTEYSIAVEWSPPPNPAGNGDVSYEVVRTYDPGLGPDSVQRRDFGVTEPAFTDRHLFPDTEYCYEVRTVEAGKVRSEWRGPYCERTLSADREPPDAPGKVKAETRSSSAVALTWGKSNSADLSHYLVAQVSVGGAAHERTWIGSAANASYVVTGLNPGTEYCFEVSAADDANNLAHGVEQACATTLASSEAEWRYQIGCKDQGYRFEGAFDLVEDYVVILGHGEDYDGAELTYSLTGSYNRTTFSGIVDWLHPLLSHKLQGRASCS